MRKIRGEKNTRMEITLREDIHREKTHTKREHKQKKGINGVGNIYEKVEHIWYRIVGKLLSM